MIETHMKAPHAVTVRQLNRMVEAWLAANAVAVGTANGETTYEHKDCGGSISFYGTYMSIHDFGDGVCAGSGEVERPTLPGCTQCVPVPPFEHGCLHPDRGQSAIELMAKAFVKAILGIPVLLLLLLFVTACSHSRKPPTASPSPVEIASYTVVNTHGAGEYLVVQRDNWYVKLHCESATEYDNDRGWSTWHGADVCYTFDAGEQITLEKWNASTYVYKCKSVKGEYQYSVE